MPGRLTMEVTITPELLAASVAEQLRPLPVRERARVLNWLLHEHRAVFDALLLRPSPSGESAFDRRR